MGSILEEYEAFLKESTWHLTMLRPGNSAIGCKWVYRVKRNPDESIACYKVQLVAKGYHREEGIDYEEAFSPIVKKPTIQIIFSLATQFD